MPRKKSNLNRKTWQATRAKWYRDQETNAQREARLAQHRESAALRRQRETSAQRDARRSKHRSAQRKRLASLRQQQAIAQRNVIFDGLRERNARETRTETKDQAKAQHAKQRIRATVSKQRESDAQLEARNDYDFKKHYAFLKMHSMKIANEHITIKVLSECQNQLHVSLEGLQSVKRSNERHEASFVSTTHAVKTPFVEVDLPSDSVVLVKEEPMVLDIEYEDNCITIETDLIKEEPSD